MTEVNLSYGSEDPLTESRSSELLDENEPLPEGQKSGGRTSVCGAIHTLSRKVVAEAIGTFFLVLTIGLSAGQGEALAPLAIGAALMAMIFAFGHISGAHFNPAVTLGVLVRGKICLVDFFAYIIFQFIGGASASAIATAQLNQYGRIVVNMTCNPDSMHMCGAGFPAVNPNFEIWDAFIAEAMYTFMLVSVVLNVATTKAQADNSFYGLAIGITVTAGAISVGAISGGAFNPVVGTVLPLSQVFQSVDPPNIWVYWLGPLLGGLLAGLVFRFTADPSEFEGEEHQAKFWFHDKRVCGGRT